MKLLMPRRKLSEQGFEHLSMLLLTMVIVVIVGVFLAVSHRSNNSCTGQTWALNSNGQCVMYAQQLANAYFSKAAPLPMDGNYSAQTVGLVKNFQSAMNLTASGTVDAKTWGKLCSTTKTSPNLYGSWAAAKAAGC